MRTLDEKMALLPAAHVEICHDLIDAMVAGHEEHREPLEALRVIPESKKEVVDLVNYFQIGLWQMKRFVAASCETCCDRRDKLEARLAAMERLSRQKTMLIAELEAEKKQLEEMLDEALQQNDDLTVVDGCAV